MSSCRPASCMNTPCSVHHTSGVNINIYDHRGKLDSCSTTNWLDLSIGSANTLLMVMLWMKNEKCMWNVISFIQELDFTSKTEHNNFILLVNILLRLTWNQRDAVNVNEAVACKSSSKTSEFNGDQICEQSKSTRFRRREIETDRAKGEKSLCHVDSNRRAYTVRDFA